MLLRSILLNNKPDEKIVKATAKIRFLLWTIHTLLNDIEYIWPPEL
jgi:hypothetical protein